ncbi:MAG: hypothetical protein HS116_22340 [Planctomycetes bacterium]|nr:hypothetical protein [Planctomycetota bacterium]
MSSGEKKLKDTKSLPQPPKSTVTPNPVSKDGKTAQPAPAQPSPKKS